MITGLVESVEWSGNRAMGTLLGSKVRQLRRGKGLSQERLAEQSKLKLLTLRDVETGKRIPTFQTIGKIADALGVPVEDFACLLARKERGRRGARADLYDDDRGWSPVNARGLMAKERHRLDEHGADWPWSPMITVGQADWLSRSDLMMD